MEIENYTLYTPEWSDYPTGEYYDNYFNEFILSEERKFFLECNFSGTQISTEDISKITFTQDLSGEDDYTFGNVSIRELKIVLKGNLIVPISTLITIRIGLLVNTPKGEGIAWTNMGNFIIDSIQNTDMNKTITAYDYLHRTNVVYSTSNIKANSEGKYKIEDILNDISSSIDVELDFNSVSEYYPLYVKLPEEELTMRSLLGHIAALSASNVIIDPKDNKIKFIKLTTSKALPDYLETNQFGNYTHNSDITYKIDKIVCAVDNEIKYKVGYGDNSYTFSNPFMSKHILTQIFEYVKNIEYNPTKIQIKGNPQVNVGDLVTIVHPKKNNGVISFPVMKLTITYTNSCGTIIESVAKSAAQKKYSLNGSITNRVNIVENTIGDINKLVVNQIEASEIITGKLESLNGKFNQLESNYAEFDRAVVDRLLVGAIEGNTVDVNLIKTAKLNADVIDAGSITGEMISANTINGEHLTSNSINSQHITSTGLTANVIKGGTLELSEGMGISGVDGRLSIDPYKMKFLDNNNTERVRIGKHEKSDYGLSVYNSDGELMFDSNKGIQIPGIGDGIISTNHISTDGLRANVINGGTLNLSSGLTIEGNTSVGSVNLDTSGLLIRDKYSTKRIIAGKLDNYDDYGIQVYNSSGKLIFDSEDGITSDGIGDGIIGGDNIGDGTISPEKLQIDQLVANKGFIKALQTVELNADRITSGTIQADRINLKGLSIVNNNGVNTLFVNNEGNIAINGTLQSDNYSDTTGYRITPDGNSVFNQAEVRGKVILPNAGLSNEGDSYDSIRLWAGTTESDKSNAPFRVNQSGDLYARRGTFGGYVASDMVSVGRLTMQNDSIHIAPYSTRMAKNGQLEYSDAIGCKVRTISDYSPYQYSFSITPDYAMFNKPIYFNRQSQSTYSALFDPTNNNFTLNNVSLKSNFTGTSDTVTTLQKEGVHFNTNPNIAGLVTTSGEHTIGYNKKKYGTLVLDSIKTGNNLPDFIFTKKNHTEDVKVSIEGELEVKNKIKSSINNIEMVNEEEGLFFYYTV